MSVLFSNNAVTRTSATVSSAATSFLVRSGEGDQFPSPTNGDIAKIVLEDRRTGELEIMDLTSRVGDQFNVIRGQEGTNSITWDEGTIVSNRLTAESLVAFSSDTADLQTQVDALVARLDEVETIAEQRKLPVSTIIATSNDINPGTYMGYGTWERYSQGRTLVGVGNNGQATWGQNEVRGNETHTLAYEEMPRHRHWNDPVNQYFETTDNGYHNHLTSHTETASSFGYTGPGDSVTNDTTLRAGNFAWANTSSGGTHKHGVNVNINPFYTDYQGSTTAHNNVQPSQATYYWRRIS